MLNLNLHNTSVPYRKMAIATLASLPIAFFLVAPKGTLNSFITAKDVIVAAPFVLEFLCFYFLYAFTKNHGKFTKYEQQLLLLLAIGPFVLLGTPVFIPQLLRPTTNVSALWLAVMLAYALASLILNTVQISKSSKHISDYVFRRYLFPAVVSVAIVLIIYSSTSIELHMVAVYFIAKNYIFALSGFSNQPT